MNNLKPKMCFFLHVTPNHFVGSDIFQQELEKMFAFSDGWGKKFLDPSLKGKYNIKRKSFALPSTASIVLLLKSAKTAGCLISVPHHSFPA